MTIELPIYQVDAFTDRVFGGNPAAIVPLSHWLDDAVLQAIAAENNLAETAFFIPDGSDYALRWFTPTVEVELCGHATLASAHVVFERLEPGRTEVRFGTRQAGPLTVTRHGDLLTLDFPSRPPERLPIPDGLAEALGAQPVAFHAHGAFGLAVFEDTAEIRALRPDFRRLGAIPHGAIIATAPGYDDVDFVSRMFAPRLGIDEDPVTGAAHCLLTPYWAARLGKSTLSARQISQRGGALILEDRGPRVGIAGQARLYLTGRITVPSAL
jgi:PhzF family phenazine biosynthesis protein